MLVDFKDKSQVTIPSKLVKQLNLKPGDKLEVTEEDGRIILVPVTIIPRDQAWFYSEQWQKEEAEIEKQIKSGRVRVAKNKEELWEGLDLSEQ